MSDGNWVDGLSIYSLNRLVFRSVAVGSSLEMAVLTIQSSKYLEYLSLGPFKTPEKYRNGNGKQEACHFTWAIPSRDWRR